MANKKITQLNVNTNPSGSDVFPIVNGGETKQLTLTGLTTYLEPFLASDYTFTGGTVSGSTTFTNGVKTNSISATTYLNLPVTQFTGGTVDGLTATTISATTYQNIPYSLGDYGLTIISGIDQNITLPDNSVIGFRNPLIVKSGYTLTVPDDTILEAIDYGFTGGTVSGATVFTNGLSANTFSATTYENLPVSPSDAGFTITPKPTKVLNSNITLPEESDVTYPSPLTIGVGYELFVPPSTTLTLV